MDILSLYHRIWGTVFCIVGWIWTICPYFHGSNPQCVVLSGEYGQFVLISMDPTHSVLYCRVNMDNLYGFPGIRPTACWFYMYDLSFNPGADSQWVVYSGYHGQFVLISPDTTHSVLYSWVNIRCTLHLWFIAIAERLFPKKSFVLLFFFSLFHY